MTTALILAMFVLLAGGAARHTYRARRATEQHLADLDARGQQGMADLLTAEAIWVLPAVERRTP